MSLAAKEASLMPEVLANFDAIAKTYEKLRRIQETRLETMREGNDPVARAERRYRRCATNWSAWSSAST